MLVDDLVKALGLDWNKPDDVTNGYPVFWYSDSRFTSENQVIRLTIEDDEWNYIVCIDQLDYSSGVEFTPLDFIICYSAIVEVYQGDDAEFVKDLLDAFEFIASNSLDLPTDKTISLKMREVEEVTNMYYKRW